MKNQELIELRMIAKAEAERAAKAKERSQLARSNAINLSRQLSAEAVERALNTGNYAGVYIRSYNGLCNLARGSELPELIKQHEKEAILLAEMVRKLHQSKAVIFDTLKAAGVDFSQCITTNL